MHTGRRRVTYNHLTSPNGARGGVLGVACWVLWVVGKGWWARGGGLGARGGGRQAGDGYESDVDTLGLGGHTVTGVLELGGQGAALGSPGDGDVGHGDPVGRPPHHLVLHRRRAELLDADGDGGDVGGQRLEPAHNALTFGFLKHT